MKTHCGLPCILILRIVLPGTCFSICDLAASVPEIQLDCNKPFRWNSRYMGEWIGPPKRSEVVNASSESFCSIQCMKNNCTVMQFLGGKWIDFKVDQYGCYINKIFVPMCQFSLTSDMIDISLGNHVFSMF